MLSIASKRLLPRLYSLSTTSTSRTASTDALNNVKIETDEFGIPTTPTWSVNELLSSYPSPKLSPETVERLYKLSALIPPARDTPEQQTVVRDLEQMIRLVEAVRLIDTTGVTPVPRAVKEDADKQAFADSIPEATGRKLLKYASRVQDNLYVVNKA
ncbi:hypothetical protein CVT24_001979 [Panaeolus cyanescens]|uniref:Glutamyl-tRNA amidotransferase complex subunit Gta3 domain-containing protein n=1 Tax=Panaeolus cyanescens TaxID=181874 RepID=A0A409YHF0_9AGAR|nr:hypothetical protein CVT24_001979 [Panaeolus cyanescens]